MNQHTQETQQHALNLWQSGKSVLEIVKETNIARSTIYRWINNRKNQPPEPNPPSQHTVTLLENKIKRMEGIFTIIKESRCSPTAPLKEKLIALGSLYGKYSVHMLCEALDVPRGTFYNHIFRNKRDNTWYAKRREELRVVIQKVYDDNNQIFGAGKIAAILKQQGYVTCEETVRRLMHDMGLVSIRQRAKALYEKERREFCKNRLRQQFDVKNPNNVWVSDVTYFHYREKNFYICAIIDLFSRIVVGYEVGLKNSTQLVKATFKKAYTSRQPQADLLFHTDRGANYKSYTFCSYLQSLNVKQSFSRAHVPYDNSVMESFFSNMKREELYRRKYRSECEILKAIDDYIIFYNTKRPHKYNKYKTPLEKEEEYFQKKMR